LQKVLHLILYWSGLLTSLGILVRGIWLPEDGTYTPLSSYLFNSRRKIPFQLIQDIARPVRREQQFLSKPEDHIIHHLTK